jgi:hypothetical protein
MEISRKRFFMKIPDGFKWFHEAKETNGAVLRLNKLIYGLVQAARQWYEKFSEGLLSLVLREIILTLVYFSKREVSPFAIYAFMPMMVSSQGPKR